MPHLHASVADAARGTVSDEIARLFADGGLAIGSRLVTESYYPASAYARAEMRSGGNAFTVVAGSAGADGSSVVQLAPDVQLRAPFPDRRYSVAQFGASGVDREADRRAFQRACEMGAGKTVVVPPGTWWYGDNTLGAWFSGTRIVCEGWLRLVPWVPEAGKCGIDFVAVSGGDYRLKLDGNRSGQLRTEHAHACRILGCSDLVIDADVREVRGDGIYVTQEDAGIESRQSERLHFRRFRGVNSADDGRNGISLISCSDVVIDDFRSEGIGATLTLPGRLGDKAVMMPGGLDLEPSRPHHRIERVHVRTCRVVTAGNLGFGMIALEGGGGTISDCHADSVHVTLRGPAGSAGAFRSVRRCEATITIDVDPDAPPLPDGRTAQAGRITDSVDCHYHVIARGVAGGPKLGTRGGPLEGCTLIADVEGHSRHAVQIGNLERCDVQARVGASAPSRGDDDGIYPCGIEFVDEDARGNGDDAATVDASDITVLIPHDAAARKGVYLRPGASGVRFRDTVLTGDMPGWEGRADDAVDVHAAGLVVRVTGMR